VAAAEVVAVFPDPRPVLMPAPQDRCRMLFVDEQVAAGPGRVISPAHAARTGIQIRAPFPV
jgi:hypothetical protein